jgi:hypothetical protein
MFMLVTLNPDAAMLSFDILSFDILPLDILSSDIALSPCIIPVTLTLRPGHADLAADMRFEVIGTHQLDAIWVFLVLQHLLAIFFGDTAGNCHLFAHGI